MRPFATPPPTPASRFTEPPRPACAGHQDDNLWHPANTDADRAAAAAMRLYCGACPIYDACLTEALTNDVHGTWAGTSARQRDAIRARTGQRPRSMATRDAARVETRGRT